MLHFRHFKLRQVLEDYAHGSKTLNDAKADFRVVESELAARGLELEFSYRLLLLDYSEVLLYLSCDLLTWLHFINNFCHGSGG